MNLIEDTFIEGGVYQLKSSFDSVFLCESLSAHQIGKLVMYTKIDNKLYERTNTSYFLTSYNETDLKAIFANRSNYEMLGRIDFNFVMSTDTNYIIQK